MSGKILEFIVRKAMEAPTARAYTDDDVMGDVLY